MNNETDTDNRPRSPETVFMVNSNTPRELDVGILSTLLARAQGIILFLSGDAEEQSEGDDTPRDTLHPIHIINALDTVEDCLRRRRRIHHSLNIPRKLDKEAT